MRGRHEYVDPFEQEALAIHEMLEQDRVWVSKDRVVHRIFEMDPGHASNCVRFLLRRAEGLHTYDGFGEVIKISRWVEVFGEPDDFDIPLASDPGADPVVWLMSTPLVKALAAQANKERLYV